MRRLICAILAGSTLAACDVAPGPVPVPVPALPGGPGIGAGGAAEAAWVSTLPAGGGGGPADTGASAAPTGAPSALPSAAASAIPTGAAQVWTVDGAWVQAADGTWAFFTAPEPRLVQPPADCPIDYDGALADAIAALPDRTARDPLTIQLYSLDRLGGASLTARTDAVAQLQRLAWRLERRGSLSGAEAARIAGLAGCWLN